jgi:hypothetical protein
MRVANLTAHVSRTRSTFDQAERSMAAINKRPGGTPMLPTNYDLARLRVDDMLRDADHRRLVKEAKAVQKASRPEGAGMLAAVRRASTAAVRLAPWKRERRPQAHGVSASAQLVAHHTGRVA